MTRDGGSVRGRLILDLLRARWRADGTLDPDRLAQALAEIRTQLAQAEPLDEEAYLAVADELEALAQELARACAQVREELQALERVRKARLGFRAHSR